MRMPNTNYNNSVRCQTRYTVFKTSEHSIGFCGKRIQEKNLRDSLSKRPCHPSCSRETFIQSSSPFSSVNLKQTEAQIRFETSIVKSHFRQSGVSQFKTDFAKLLGLVVRGSPGLWCGASNTKDLHGDSQWDIYRTTKGTSISYV
jgi:hypothetical protein